MNLITTYPAPKATPRAVGEIRAAETTRVGHLGEVEVRPAARPSSPHPPAPDIAHATEHSSTAPLEGANITDITPAPMENPTNSPAALLQSLRGILETHQGAARLIIDDEGLFLPADSVNSIRTPAQGRGTMARLRERVEAAGFSELNRAEIFRDQLPQEGGDMRIGEDPLTPERLQRIIGLLEDHLSEKTLQIDPENSEDIFKDVAGEKTDEHFSLQDRFEQQLEMLRGKNLVSNDKVGGEMKSLELDGVSMIADLAEGRIEFPLQRVSLHDYSLQELRYALAVALGENIEKIEQQIKSLEEEKPENSSLKSKYLEDYKESLTKAAEILWNLTEERKAPGSEEEKFVFKIIKMLHQVFCIRVQTLEAHDRGDTNRARSLHNQADALIRLAEELSRDQPRVEIIGRLNESLTLFRQALEALDRGNTHRARYLNNQANALYSLTDELSRDQPRVEIIGRLNESLTLWRQTLETYNRGDTHRATYLNNQALALNRLSQELSRDQPRQSIINGYKESFDLSPQALEALDRGDTHRARYLNNQVFALFNLTQELSRDQPRQTIIDGYKESLDLLRPALEAHDRGDTNQAALLNNQANALLRDLIGHL